MGEKIWHIGDYTSVEDLRLACLSVNRLVSDHAASELDRRLAAKSPRQTGLQVPVKIKQWVYPGDDDLDEEP
jgi:hypothetical protein